MLLGGEPFTEHVLMWWNFVGRTHEEIAGYREEWQGGSARFGRVEGYRGQVQRLPAPPMPTVRLKARLAPPGPGTPAPGDSRPGTTVREMPRALVTNDDGIDSPGLWALAPAAARAARLDVVVAAPHRDCSGVGTSVASVRDGSRTRVPPRTARASA